MYFHHRFVLIWIVALPSLHEHDCFGVVELNLPDRLGRLAKVPDKPALLDIPQLDAAVVACTDHTSVIKLETGHRVIVRRNLLYALKVLKVPDAKTTVAACTQKRKLATFFFSTA